MAQVEEIGRPRIFVVADGTTVGNSPYHARHFAHPSRPGQQQTHNGEYPSIHGHGVGIRRRSLLRVRNHTSDHPRAAAILNLADGATRPGERVESRAIGVQEKLREP